MSSDAIKIAADAKRAAELTRGRKSNLRCERIALKKIAEKLRSSHVLAQDDRLFLATLLERVSMGLKPFEPRKRSVGHPKKPSFNPASIQAIDVAAEYVLALRKEGGWGAKKQALPKALELINSLFPDNDLTAREIDDESRRFKAARISPRPAIEFEQCTKEDIDNFRSGNPDVQRYLENLGDQVSDTEEYNAYYLLGNLETLARGSAEKVALEASSFAANQLASAFRSNLRNQFQIEFYKQLQGEIDALILDVFFLELSRLLPPALNACTGDEIRAEK